MEDLAPAETHVELDLIALVEEAPGLLGLHRDVVLVGFGLEANLLGFGLLLVLARLALLLALLVAEFAVVHQAANRRHRGGRHLNQVEAPLLGELHSVADGDDADLGSLIVDQAHLACADAVVDA